MGRVQFGTAAEATGAMSVAGMALAAWQSVGDGVTFTTAALGVVSGLLLVLSGAITVLWRTSETKSAALLTAKDTQLAEAARERADLVVRVDRQSQQIIDLLTGAIDKQQASSRQTVEVLERVQSALTALQAAVLAQHAAVVAVPKDAGS